jgi:hypothetical protein
LGPPFRFFTIAERIFYAGEEDDRWTATLDNPRCVDPDTVNEFSILQDWNRVATSEAALVHWLWLARSPRQPLSMPPPHDLDVGGLDLERLSRLAKDAGLEEEAERLVEECIRLSRSEDDGVEDGYVPSF